MYRAGQPLVNWSGFFTELAGEFAAIKKFNEPIAALNS